MGVERADEKGFGAKGAEGDPKPQMLNGFASKGAEVPNVERLGIGEVRGLTVGVVGVSLRRVWVMWLGRVFTRGRSASTWGPKIHLRAGGSCSAYQAGRIVANDNAYALAA